MVCMSARHSGFTNNSLIATQAQGDVCWIQAMYHSYARKFLRTCTWTEGCETPQQRQSRLPSLGSWAHARESWQTPRLLHAHGPTCSGRIHAQTRAQLHAHVSEAPAWTELFELSVGAINPGYIEHIAQYGLDPYSHARQTPQSEAASGQKEQPTRSP